MWIGATFNWQTRNRSHVGANTGIGCYRRTQLDWVESCAVHHAKDIESDNNLLICHGHSLCILQHCCQMFAGCHLEFAFDAVDSQMAESFKFLVSSGNCISKLSSYLWLYLNAMIDHSHDAPTGIYTCCCCRKKFINYLPDLSKGLVFSKAELVVLAQRDFELSFINGLQKSFVVYKLCSNIGVNRE